MPLDKDSIKKIVMWSVFAVFFIIMLIIMHPAWWGIK